MTREKQLQRESEVYAWTADQFDIQLAFKKGAEWEHKRLVEKACNWLVANASDYAISTTGDDDDCVVSLDMVGDFRKAMEE